ncbi:MAG: DUF1592 domain-containing protein [Planctomycetaceae bacterium]
MARQLLVLLVLFSIGSGIPSAIGADDTQSPEEDYSTRVLPVFKTFCFECHTGDTAEAGVDLSGFPTIAEVRRQPNLWIKVRTMLDSGQMPPRDSPQPSQQQQAELQSWVRALLLTEAEKHAGDPGPVVLRRLSNDEYNYTVRDLTRVPSLNPTREFPVDGAAGEGFINSGAGQGMSPALITKYLDAGKNVAGHAVLLPTGIAFSPYVTRRDQTDQLAAQIQAFYRQFTSDGGGQPINLQGIRFNTNEGGVLPLQRYLLATLEERAALTSGMKTVAQIAQERHLSPKYLATLWTRLSTPQSQSSPVVDRIQAQWQQSTPADGARLVAMIGEQQKILFQFNTIGHIGRKGKPKIWMEPVTPMAARRDFSLKLPDEATSDVPVFLVAGDAGDSNSADYVVWQNPRLVQENGPDILLRDIAGLRKRMRQVQREALSRTTAYLAAVSEYATATGEPQKKLAAMAAKHRLDESALKVWLDYLTLNEAGVVNVAGHLTRKETNSTYNFIRGLGDSATPVFLSNSSDNEVRIPGIARPHQIQVHPSPTLFIAAGWRSPISGPVRIEARLSDAHPECGNGQEWFLQHRTMRKTGNLWQGDFPVGGSATMTPKLITVRRGELISFIVGPKQGSHACDLTEIHLVITEMSGRKRTWNLSQDVAGTIQDANPHPDRHGNQKTWHFYQGQMKSLNQQANSPISVPDGSLLAKWQVEKEAEKRSALAVQIQKLATGDGPVDKSSPDGLLYGQLMELAMAPPDPAMLPAGIEPDKRFGQHPLGHKVGAENLVVRAPAIVEFHIPARLANGRRLVTGGMLDAQDGQDGSVQIEASLTRIDPAAIPLASPILTHEGSRSHERVANAFREFHTLFPPNLCYARIVPVDEVVTLTLFYRQDDSLQQLMLNESQSDELNRMWDELFFVAQEPLRFEVAFEQIREFATQDRPDLVKVWDPLKQEVVARASGFRKQLIQTEPVHLNAVLEFASRAWRRALSTAEQSDLRNLYRKLREAELSHEQSIRLSLARVLTSPAFLYRREQQPDSDSSEPVSDIELATRLSYFLWSSAPDAQLAAAALSSSLSTDEQLRQHTGRMLADPRIRRLAIQFACQWLHLRNFDQNNEKNEKLYPEFADIRGDMYEETVRFFEHMFRADASILDLLNADYTFVNRSLARHYGLPFPNGPGLEWQRVNGIRKQGRGGILGMATFLSSQSGASRTSPILRGNWVSETLLGETLPKPPVGVPVLPEEVPTGLTARELIEKHSSAPACAKCHSRIDPYGFALEQFDVLGRLRPEKVDTETRLPSGETLEGLAGLREYLLAQRQDDVVRQFCRKLLGFALGRAVQLSDEPLIDTIMSRLRQNHYHFHTAVKSIVLSPQFRHIRGSAFSR